jgi:hypothetical protein
LELTEFGERRTLVISSVEIDGQQEIGNESGQKLHHQSVRTSGNEVIDVEMAFPPCEERFDVEMAFPPCEERFDGVVITHLLSDVCIGDQRQPFFSVNDN